MKIPRRRFLHLAAGAAALPVVSRIARADTYPARTITAIVPASAGGRGHDRGDGACRISISPCDARYDRESCSPCCEMQKSTARNFHEVPLLKYLQHGASFCRDTDLQVQAKAFEKYTPAAATAPRCST